jgi:carbon-monoxide dehydrogenase large subunit
MLHKFEYRPIGYPVLADGVVRLAGECVAAAVAPTEEEAEDIVDRIGIEIDENKPLIDSLDAVASGAPNLHPESCDNIIVQGQVKTEGFDAVWNEAHEIVEIAGRSIDVADLAHELMACAAPNRSRPRHRKQGP